MLEENTGKKNDEVYYPSNFWKAVNVNFHPFPFPYSCICYHPPFSNWIQGFGKLDCLLTSGEYVCVLKGLSLSYLLVFVEPGVSQKSVKLSARRTNRTK
ncbi:hypothetical protein L1987_47458 [Smallanthus sonchifolius]|uniref:Uncharacterized protein n=1 Tax=Smallanthus sonchifolius TaxID=185202 RepID=A0ACB9G4D9_9ASTR|nr:hypothetical protein L1987_47458 [Smallanthus sonchifolius]